MGYHDRTLRLLGDEPLLRAAVARPTVGLPAAVAEWIDANGWAILAKYSNMDDFGLGDVVETEDGARGISFHRENQGNFDRLFQLDGGDDPPVRFGWVGGPPWIVNAGTFSAAVYAQVFDWQFQLEFEDGEARIAYHAVVTFRHDAALDVLARRYEEVVSTWFRTELGRFSERRFLVAPTLRLHAWRGERGDGTIEVMGTDKAEIRALHDELVGHGFTSHWR